MRSRCKNETVPNGVLAVRYFQNSRGASVVECAIVFPVLLMLTLGFLDFSCCLAARAAITAGTSRALALASTISGLDDDPAAADSGHAQAIARVLEEAKKVPLGTLLSDHTEPSMMYLSGEPELILPPTGAEGTLKTALENKPITVRLRATIVPMTPFLPTFEIVSESVGYRESKSGVSLPVPTDCAGRPFGDPGYFKSCPCPAGSSYVEAERRCVTCPDGQGWHKVTRKCVPCPGDMVTNSAWGFGPGDPKYYASSLKDPPMGCKCPSTNYCRNLRNMGPWAMGSNIWCDCRCNSGDGFKTVNGQCACINANASVVPMPGWGGLYSLCRCINDQAMTIPKCEALYGVGKAIPSDDGCGCKCKTGCGASAYWPSLPNCEQCGCYYAGHTHTPGVGCSCSNKNEPCEQAGNTRDPITCQCKCTRTCKAGTLNAGRCSCECSSGVDEDSSGNCPTTGTEPPPATE